MNFVWLQGLMSVMQVTKRRLWKLVHDQMGGRSDAAAAGAAKATRRNYEKYVKTEK